MDEDIEESKGIRQLTIFGLTIILALLLFKNCYSSPPNEISYSFKMTIFFYGFGIPLILLFTSLIDLDDYRISLLWSVLGFIHLVIYVLNYDNATFYIPYHRHHHPSNFELQYISRNSLASLRALPIFLLFYQLFNMISKILTGNMLVQALKQEDTHHYLGKRRILITDLDRLLNFILLLLIILSGCITF